MNKLGCIILIAGALAISGCGSKEQTAPTAPGAKPAAKPAPTATAPAEVPPPAPPPVAPPPTAAAPAVVPAVAPAGGTQANGLVTATDREGNTRTGEQMIYRAIELYVEGQGKPWPKSVEELVEAKVLQSVPPAPSGMKWAIDLKQHKVITVSQ